MFVLLFLSFLLSFLIFSICLNEYGIKDSWLCAIASVTVTVLYTFLSVETLSLFRKIGFTQILSVWIILCSLQMVFVYVLTGRYGLKTKDLKELFRFRRPRLLSLNTLTAFLCAEAVFFSLTSTPNNYDGMSYHLPRIMHWLQNGSVAHYACHDISQISDPYLAEFVNLHVYLLSGSSDRFLNLLQTFSYIVTILLIYRISVKIGCNSLWASLASLIYAASPIVFGEALNVQVDLFAGLWLMFFAYLTLWFIDSNGIVWRAETVFRIILMGIICGLAYAAKASVLFGILVFAGWLVICCLARKDRIRDIALCSAGVIVPAGIIVLPELIRNIITFGRFAANESSTQFLIPSFSPRYFIFNLLLNIAFNLPNDVVNTEWILKKVIRSVRHILFPHQKTPTGLKEFAFLDNPNTMNHDSALNSVVMWLFILACAVVICIGIYCFVKKKKNPLTGSGTGIYWCPAFLAFIMFLGLVAWYKNINRYETAYYSLILPGIVYVLQTAFSGKRGRIAGSIIIAVSVFMVLHYSKIMYDYQMKHYRQGMTRTQEYFRYRDMYDEYRMITGYINDHGYQQLGFMCGPGSIEYPFWVMTDRDERHIEHVNVMNETVRYADPDFRPDCIFTTDVKHVPIILCNGKYYCIAVEKRHTVLYLPVEKQLTRN